MCEHNEAIEYDTQGDTSNMRYYIEVEPRLNRSAGALYPFSSGLHDTDTIVRRPISLEKW